MYTMKNDLCDNWINQLTDDMICAANEDTAKAGIDACHVSVECESESEYQYEYEYQYQYENDY